MIKHRAVSFDLFGESLQGVLVALYFITCEAAVNDSNVGAAPAVAEAQFVQDERIRERAMPPQHLAVKTFPYQRVVHPAVIRPRP